MRALTLVIPCKDEAKRLVPAAFLAALDTHPYLTFVFVDDGSTDNTAEMLALMERASPAVHALYLPHNVGKAEAVRQGANWALAHTTSEAVGFWDADLATPLDELDAFVRRLDGCRACQAVFGARWPHLGAQIDRNVFRHCTGAVMKSLIRLVVKASVYDTQCGAKVFRRELAERVFARPFISRWLFDVEIIRRIPRGQVERVVTEIPLGFWRDVKDSKLRCRDSLRLFWDLARINFATPRGCAI